MKFIKLTLFSNKSVFINADMIACVEEGIKYDDKEKFAIVKMLMGEPYIVKESVKKVMKMIEGAKQILKFTNK